MFFPRLRRRAKWVFAFLAFAFALAFVVAGVGTGLGSGVGDYLADLFNRQPGTGDSDVGKAREEAVAAPKDDAKLERYLEAIFQDQSLNVDQQIAEMNRYLELRPDDPNALQQLAGLYLTKGGAAEQRAQSAQILASRAFFANEIQSPGGAVSQAIGVDPITSQIRQEASTNYSIAVAAAQDAYKKESEVWQKVTKLQPEEASSFFELGRSAQQGGDTTLAITAFERYLELAPESPDAAQIRELLKQLKLQQDAAQEGQAPPGP
ncbi:MAG: tetratricopeptide repeat protein [Actinobacteria bacterium]|nr:tetratricopeptide repeat protein [Actinomycetota bacterium]